MTNSTISTESDFPDKYMSRPARMYCYMLCVAVCIVLGTFNIINNEYIGALNYLFAMVFGVAAQNVPKVNNGTE